MSDTEKKHRKKIQKIEKSESKKSESEKSENFETGSIGAVSGSESEVTICSWYTYKHTRCSRKSNGSKFCDLHNTLKKDLRILKKEETDELSCATQKEIKFTPRSKNHIKQVMTRLNYDQQYVDVCFPGGLIEEGTLEDDDFINMPDETKIYYAPTEKNKLKTKNIKILFIDYCQNDPIVSIRGDKNGEINDSVYCESCYKKLSKKIGYPKLSVIRDQ